MINVAEIYCISLRRYVVNDIGIYCIPVRCYLMIDTEVFCIPIRRYLIINTETYCIPIRRYPITDSETLRIPILWYQTNGYCLGCGFRNRMRKELYRLKWYRLKRMQANRYPNTRIQSTRMQMLWDPRYRERHRGRRSVGTYWVLRDMGTEYGGSNHSGAKLCQNTALECNFLGVQSMRVA